MSQSLDTFTVCYTQERRLCGLRIRDRAQELRLVVRTINSLKPLMEANGWHHQTSVIGDGETGPEFSLAIMHTRQLERIDLSAVAEGLGQYFGRIFEMENYRLIPAGTESNFCRLVGICFHPNHPVCPKGGPVLELVQSLNLIRRVSYDPKRIEEMVD